MALSNDGGVVLLTIDKFGNYANDGSHPDVTIKLANVNFANQTINEITPGVFDLLTP